MKKTYIFITAFICICFGVSYGAAVNAGDVLSKIEAADKNVKDMEFNFTQKINYVSTNEKQTSSGIVKYKKQNYITTERAPPITGLALVLMTAKEQYIIALIK